MARRQLLVGDFRVQAMDRSGGWRSFTIVGPDGLLVEEADRFLLGFDGSGTQRTYAHYLVDHLRWRAREGLDLAAVTLRDLERYMGSVGAKVSGPFGEPWRVGKRPYGNSALATAAACLKGFYLHHAARGVNAELATVLDRSRLPTRADRRRRLLGHTTRSLPSNPLAPARVRRRHPKMLPEGTRGRLLETVGSARDRLVVAWLADGGFRIGELLRPASGGSAPAGRRGVRGVSLAARARLSPARQPEPGECEDQAAVGGGGRHGHRWAD